MNIGTIIDSIHEYYPKFKSSMEYKNKILFFTGDGLLGGELVWSDKYKKLFFYDLEKVLYHE